MAPRPCGIVRRAASRTVRNPPNAEISIAFAHGFRVEFGNRTMRAGAGVVEHEIGFAEPVIRLCEQAGHRSRIRCVDGEGLGVDFRDNFFTPSDQEGWGALS
jgi:hypothetical protein